MLLPNLIPLIDVTFSTPTPDYVNYLKGPERARLSLVRAFVRSAILLVTPAILIALAYPVTTYFRYFDFPFLVTLFSYVIVYLLVLAVCAGVAPSVAAKFSKTPVTRAVLQVVTGVLCFAILSFICGPIGLDLPHIRLGIFFSEWKFVNFFCYVGLPATLASAATGMISEH